MKAAPVKTGLGVHTGLRPGTGQQCRPGSSLGMLRCRWGAGGMGERRAPAAKVVAFMGLMAMFGLGCTAV